MPPRRLATSVSPEILVVDPDAGMRDFKAGVLQRGGFRVKSVASAEEALAMAEQETPAVVLLELGLGAMSGYEVCCALQQEHQGRVPVIFVSGDRTEPRDRAAGLLIGADDYLTKPINGDELIARVRAVLRRAQAVRSRPSPRQDELTARELEVLQLLADGLDQAAIAGRLVISPKTVAKHIERILSKLPAHSRAEAVAIAYRRGVCARGRPDQAQLALASAWR